MAGSVGNRSSQSLPPLPPSPEQRARSLSPTSFVHVSNSADGSSEEGANDPFELPQAEIPIDILIYTFEEHADTPLVERITKGSALSQILESSSHDSEEVQPKGILLAIEDISAQLERLLLAHGVISMSTLEEHYRGRVNDPDHAKPKRKKLHADSMEFTLFDRVQPREQLESLTWWKLFTHSRAGYGLEQEALDEQHADTKKLVVPHFAIQISDTFKDSTPIKNEARLKSATAIIRQRVGKKLEKSNEESETLQDYLRGLDPVQKYTLNRYYLECNTYRPHQVITEVSDETWGAAAEERITFGQKKKGNTTFCKSPLISMV
jgi:hypothetical protein